MSNKSLRATILLAGTILLASVPSVAGRFASVEPDSSQSTQDSSTQRQMVASVQLQTTATTSGGILGAQAPGIRMSATMGQIAVTSSAAPNVRMGLGFWPTVGEGNECPVAITGDVNASGGISAADIVYMVNQVFKAGPAPLPCPASGDVNCSGTLSPADIIYLVNFVFKAGAVPCDVCTLVPAAWACP